MADHYAFEDFTPGMTMTFGPRLVTRDEIIAFAQEFDPQPFHLDEDAANMSLLGGLAGSGWHVCCLMMRMIVDGFIGNSTSMGAPGVEEVKWLRPLRPDRAITVRTTVLETRASQSKPDRGFVKLRCDVLDDAGDVIMRLTTPLMFGRRARAA